MGAKIIFREIIERLDGFAELSEAVSRGNTPVMAVGVSPIHKAQIAVGLYTGAPVLIITDDEANATRLCSDINEMSRENRAVLFPAKDLTLASVEGVSREYEHGRIGVLSRILNNRVSYVVAGIEAALQLTIPPDVLSKRTVRLAKGDAVSTESLAQQLINIGYTRSERTDGVSQFSVRGDIFDIYPTGSVNPVRMELWGDEIDSISYFDTETQRRTESIDEFLVPPALETVFTSPEQHIEVIERLIKSARGKRAELVKGKFNDDIDRLRNGLCVGSIDKYIPVAYDEKSTIFDYFGDESPIILSELVNIREKTKNLLAQHTEDLKILIEDGELSKEMNGYYMEYPMLLSVCSSRRTVLADTFLRGKTEIPQKKLINFVAHQTAPWGGEIRQLIEDLQAYIKRGYFVCVMAGSDKTLPIIADDLREEKIPCDILSSGSKIVPGRVVLMTGSASGGFDYPDIKCAMITQARASASVARKLKKRKKGEEIRSLSDISEGDLIVHVMHGIGRFVGIRKLEMEGITKDYITIHYAGTDVLYVPVTQLDLVSKYIGPRDDSGVKLNKLSSTDWQKTRARVKKAVKDMAEELIALYAKRSQTKGYAFAPDNDWQNDFEERFEFEETDDQLRSIEEIKADMQKTSPMDRLLCGDVGFGKTEVAFRAAFKCVLESKQCAILVPTTVLAWQHFQTALKRFEHFPVKIELLSRFRTAKQQQEIIKNIKNGTVDIIVGTHRLIQKDVTFRDLGLVIIDEEQRFGVAHKERFKEVFAGVDVLTLSATPIPRTLNMAMSGIRDMSVIEEPPQDRYPVQTYVIEHNDGIIAQAITKELRRGGQVYYIHNRIDSIEQCAEKLRKLLPEARIATAHGQVSEEYLSEVWRQLVDYEIDILVCTTIIETGVDVPNCNTLIIENADKLGLSQLYQLRGRVGRSNRRAFAYFTFRRGKMLSEIASKRLDAIREFTQFGSGFRIALRDLEIRGAGSILGGQQHGHMEAVGYDMYLRLLSEAVAEQKGEKPDRKSEDCLIDVQIEAHIPDNYIESLSQRLDIYRKIAAVSTQEESMDLIDELIDRYGEPPKAISGLITVSLLRNTASRLNITEISQRSGNMIFYTDNPPVERIGLLVSTYKSRVTINGSGKSNITVKLSKDDKPIDVMQSVLGILDDSDMTLKQ